MNNYNIKVTNKKKLKGNITKTTINVTNKDKKVLSLRDIKAVVNQLNTIDNPKYKMKFTVVASTPFNKNFNMKSYDDENIKYDSIREYLDGRVKDTTKYMDIGQISITMHKELI